jgi:hypothetical protein
MSVVDSATTKRCRECGVVKSVDDFTPEPRNRDGRQGRCKACNNACRKPASSPEGYVPPAEKACTRCGLTQPLAAFSSCKYKWDGRQSVCRRCDRAYKKDFKSHPDGRVRVSGWEKRSKLKYRYGITLDDYERLLAEQDGRCAICGKLPKGIGREVRLHVDHDHDTGRVRGLICLKCNSALAQFGDSLEGVMKAVEYLKRSIEVTS